MLGGSVVPLGLYVTKQTRPPGGQFKNRLHGPCAHAHGSICPRFIPISQFKVQLHWVQLELRITHIRCYNEKVEVLASLGPQKIVSTLISVSFQIVMSKTTNSPNSGSGTAQPHRRSASTKDRYDKTTNPSHQTIQN